MIGAVVMKHINIDVKNIYTIHINNNIIVKPWWNGNCILTCLANYKSHHKNEKKFD